METSFLQEIIGCYKKKERKFYFWSGPLEGGMLSSVDLRHKQKFTGVNGLAYHGISSDVMNLKDSLGWLNVVQGELSDASI